MPEERGLYPKMKVLEHIVYLARLHGYLEGRCHDQRAQSLLEQLGLGERLGDNVETLSLGNQQRAQIAAALVHDPEVLILDEPFSGLDPLAVDVVAGVLQARAAEGTAVLFSSHQLDVVERLCDDLVIIADGTIRAAGSRDCPPRPALCHSASSSSPRPTPGGCARCPESPCIEFDGGYALFDADTRRDRSGRAAPRRRAR